MKGLVKYNFSEKDYDPFGILMRIGEDTNRGQTNYSTGKAYISSLKLPSKTQNLKLIVNGQSKLIEGPL